MIRGTGKTMSETGPKRKRDWTIDTDYLWVNGGLIMWTGHPHPLPLGMPLRSRLFFLSWASLVHFGFLHAWPSWSNGFTSSTARKSTSEHPKKLTMATC